VREETAPSVARPAAPAPARAEQKKNHAEPIGPAVVDKPSAPVSSDAVVAQFRKTLHEAAPMLEVMLDDAAAVGFDGRTLTVTFPNAASATRRQMEKPESLETLRRAAEACGGGNVEVRVIDAGAGGEMPKVDRAAQRQPVAETGAKRATVPRTRGGWPPSVGADQGALLDSVKKEPGVARLLKELGAQVVEIRALDAPADVADDETTGDQES
jgi:hypothetical protein